MRTRTRFPSGTMPAIELSTWFSAESVCDRAAHRDVPGLDDDADPAAPGGGAHHEAAGVERHLREPVRQRARVPREQVAAGQARDEGVGRRVHELRGRSELEDPALREHADAVGEDGGVLVVVGDEERGQVEVAQQLGELESHGRARDRVERGERLVQQQHGRVARERARQADALPLAARELTRPCLRQVPDTEALEQLVHARAPASERDVAPHGQVREERVVLEDVAHAALLRRDGPSPVAESNQTSSPTATRPRVGPDEAADAAQDGRLARAGRPDEGDRLAADVERQPEAEGSERTVEIDAKRAHPGTTLTASRSAPDTATSNAPIARAMSKSASSWS